MFKLVLEKAEEPEIKLPTSAGSFKNQDSSRKNIYFHFIEYAKAFDCVDHNKLWKILKEMGKPNHLTCLLRNLYAGQEATVRTGHEQQTGQPAEYIMWNGWLDEAHARIKIASRNINNFIYADDTTLWQKLKRN